MEVEVTEENHNIGIEKDNESHIGSDVEISDSFNTQQTCPIPENL